MSRSEQERFTDILHEYFRIDTELILDIVENQLAPLADRLRPL